MEQSTEKTCELRARRETLTNPSYVFHSDSDASMTLDFDSDYDFSDNNNPGKSTKKGKTTKNELDKKVSEKTKLECEICKKVFTRPNILRDHMNIHTGSKPHKCQYCEKLFATRRAVYIHTRNHHAGTSLSCPVCDKKCTTKPDLIYHMNKHPNADKTAYPFKGENLISCQQCDRKFSYKSHLNHHLKQSHIPKEHNKCDICNMDFTTNDSLKRHKSAIHSEDRLKCKFCLQQFQHKSILTFHISNVHKEELLSQSKHTCPTCGKKYTTKSIMEQHRRFHTGIGLFKCEICSKVYTKNSYLLEHMRSHTNERPYTCQVCGKSFQTSGGLKLHRQRKHKDIYSDLCPWPCDQCESRFNSNKALQDHIFAYHTGLPHVCSVCGKGFKKMHSLNVHQVIHKEKHTLDKSKDPVLSIKKKIIKSKREKKQKPSATKKMKQVSATTSARKMKQAPRVNIKDKHAPATSNTQDLIPNTTTSKPAVNTKVPVILPRLQIKNEKELDGHIVEKRIEDGLLYNCDMCDYDSIDSQFFIVCNETFASLEFLIAHNQAYHDTELAFDDGQKLMGPVDNQRKKEATPYLLKIKLNVTNEKQLDEYLNNRRVDLPCFCEICKRVFEDNEILKQHLMSYQIPIKCHTCKQRCLDGNRNSLIIHLKHAHLMLTELVAQLSEQESVPTQINGACQVQNQGLTKFNPPTPVKPLNQPSDSGIKLHQINDETIKLEIKEVDGETSQMYKFIQTDDGQFDLMANGKGSRLVAIDNGLVANHNVLMTIDNESQTMVSIPYPDMMEHAHVITVKLEDIADE